MDPEQQPQRKDSADSSAANGGAAPAPSNVTWVSKGQFTKEEAEKDAKERSYQQVLKKRVRIASLGLAFSVIALILIFATPLGSILPTFQPGSGSREIAASPLVGIAIAVAAVSYVMLILDGGSLLRQRSNGSGKMKFLISSLVVLALLVVFNPISIVFILFLVYCNITVCAGT